MSSLPWIAQSRQCQDLCIDRSRYGKCNKDNGLRSVDWLRARDRKKGGAARRGKARLQVKTASFRSWVGTLRFNGKRRADPPLTVQKSGEIQRYREDGNKNKNDRVFES